MAKYKYEPIKTTLNLDVSNEAQIRAAEINASAITRRLEGRTPEEQANILYSAVQDLGNRKTNAIVKVLAQNMLEKGIPQGQIDDILRQGKAAYEASKEQPKTNITKEVSKAQPLEVSRIQPDAEVSVPLDRTEPLSPLGVATKVSSPELQAPVVSKPQPGEEGFTYQRVELSHPFEGDLLTAYIKVKPSGYVQDLLSGKSIDEQANILYSAQMGGNNDVIKALENYLTNQRDFSPEQIESIKRAANLEKLRIKLEEDQITAAERGEPPISMGEAPSSKTATLKKVDLPPPEELVRVDVPEAQIPISMGKVPSPKTATLKKVDLPPPEELVRVDVPEAQIPISMGEAPSPKTGTLKKVDLPPPEELVRVDVPEARDSVILGGNIGKGPSVTALSSSEVDPITEAIRKEILAEQQKLIKTQIALSDPAVNDMGLQQFREYLTSAKGKEEAAKVFAKPEIQTTLNNIEVEGYRKVHTEFSDSFKNVNWTPDQITGTGQPKTKTSEITNENGKVVAKIKETTHDIAPLAVTLDNGDKVNVKSYRTIDFPKELEAGTGPLHLSMAVKDQNGRNISEKDAVYFTAHYDEQGKLTEISSPIPVKFMGKGDDAVGYIERVGPDGKPKVYTLPVTQGKYKEMMREVAKNQGMAVDLSQEVAQEAQDRALTQEKARAPVVERDAEDVPPQKKPGRSEGSSALETDAIPLEIVSTYGLTGAEKTRAIDNMLRGASPEKIVATLKDQVAKGGSEAVELIVEATKEGRSGDHPGVRTLTAEQFREVYETGMKAAKTIADAPQNSHNSKVQKLKMENILSACTKLASPANIEDAAHKQARTTNRVSFGQNNPPQKGR